MQMLRGVGGGGAGVEGAVEAFLWQAPGPGNSTRSGADPAPERWAGRQCFITRNIPREVGGGARLTEGPRLHEAWNTQEPAK